MNSVSGDGAADRLSRQLGTGGAVVVGLGAMLGAGVFAVLAPSAQVAGANLLPALAVAALVACCNAISSARLAARHPESGGAYVYGRERLGPFWGHLAGWGFVVGKAASCAAMALTAAAYLLPAASGPGRTALAVGVVLALTALNYRGVRKSAALTRALVAITLAVLTLVVVLALTSDGADAARLAPPAGTGGAGVLQAAGLLFFAFAGYARVATLGEEVRDPSRTIPRAVAVALGLTLLVYVAVAGAALAAVGPAELAAAPDPLATVVAASDVPSLTPLVRVGAAAAALGALLALVLGVSRTVFAMARDGHLPRRLAAVHPRFGGPHRAEVAVGLVVAVLVSLVDLRDAIGFSSFAVLVYYAIANVAAWTLSREEHRPPRVVPATGLLGCLVLAVTLPAGSVLAGIAALGLGVLSWAGRRWVGGRRRR
ncbi:APC family permease [Actinoalloteichus caeruleus]|uniref:APC family permease n=1 Tax=Actinoalloteichus cyanogriseus TaxID=2893586 RepID=UPI003BB93086